MLGFTTLSEAPISEATTSLEALAYLPGSLSQVLTGVLLTDAKASIATSSATSIITANTFEDVDAQARITPTGVTVTSVITSFDEVVGQATVIPDSTATSLTAYVGDFADVDAKAHVFISPVESATNTSMLAFDAKARITTPTVTSVTTVSDLLTEALAFTTFSGIDLTLSLDLETPIGIRFPYQDYADDYSRGRTLYLLGYANNNTVYVGEESRASYVEGQDQNYTVHVAPENRSVVIEKQQGSNTVHITA